MIDNRYIIKDFDSKYDLQVQEFENSFARSSHLLGLIKLQRSYDIITYSNYFDHKHGQGFILIILDTQQNNKIVGKAIFQIKKVLIANQTYNSVYINELRIANDINKELQLESHIIKAGLNKAKLDYQCQFSQILIDSQKDESKYKEILESQLEFQKIGDIVSYTAMQNNLLKIEEQIGDFKFKEIEQNQAQEYHLKQKNRGDFYNKQIYENKDNVSTYIFADDKNENIYGMSLFQDDKKYQSNFTRFFINSKLLKSQLFIKLFYTFVNVFFASLLYFERRESQLMDDDIRFKIILYVGLNIGICLAFFQTQKAFMKFSGNVGRIFQPFEIENIPLPQTKKREIFETLIRNIQGKCFEKKINQIRIDMDQNCDHLDYFGQKSLFVPYNSNQYSCYVAQISTNSYPLGDIKFISVDPRDF